eukprot:Skav225040  [mRNA]  locus=scaffold2061:285305:292010:+ [translate_table: standard]
MAAKELDGESLVTCCRCSDADGGSRVTKLPEWNTQVEEDDEEEINFGPLSTCSDRPRRPAIESWSSLGRLKPEDLDFSELTPESGALRIANVDRRGINFDQLKKILVYVKKRCDSEDAVRGWYDHRTGEQLFYKKMTLAQVHQWLIRPLSLRHQCSYVEAIAKKEHAQLPAWFVGHSWDEPMVDFVRRVMKHGTLGAGDAFWCHPFACRPPVGGGSGAWQCCEMNAASETGVEPFGELTHLKAHLKNCKTNSIEEWLSIGVPAMAELKRLDLTVSDSPKLAHAGQFSRRPPAVLQELRVTFRCPVRTADAFCKSLQHLSGLQATDLTELLTCDKVQLDLAKSVAELAQGRLDVVCAGLPEEQGKVLFDLINHSSFGEEHCVQLDFEAEDFVVRCSKDVAAGSELFKSYGEHSDAELLRTYGFVPLLNISQLFLRVSSFDHSSSGDSKPTNQVPIVEPIGLSLGKPSFPLSAHQGHYRTVNKCGMIGRTHRAMYHGDWLDGWIG